MKAEKSIPSAYVIPGIPRYAMQKDIVCERQFKEHLDDVIKLTCKVFKEDPEPIRKLIYKGGEKRGGNKRKGSTSELCAIMHACVYLSYTTAPIGFQKVGNVMGGRNHSTIIYAIRKVEGLCEVYSDYRKKINTVLFRMGQPQLPKQGKWNLR